MQPELENKREKKSNNDIKKSTDDSISPAFRKYFNDEATFTHGHTFTPERNVFRQVNVV